jgi:hypothetical protein
MAAGSYTQNGRPIGTAVLVGDTVSTYARVTLPAFMHFVHTLTFLT